MTLATPGFPDGIIYLWLFALAGGLLLFIAAICFAASRAPQIYRSSPAAISLMLPLSVILIALMSCEGEISYYTPMFWLSLVALTLVSGIVLIFSFVPHDA